MLRFFTTLAVLAVALAGVTSDAVAQMRGGGGGMSAFSGMGGGMGGMSAFGGNRMGGMGGMSSGFGGMSGGMGGMSGFGGGGSGFGGMSGFGGNQSFGGGMMGGNMGGQNFIGRDGGDMNAVMQQMGRAGTQFFNNMNSNMSGRNNRNRQQPEDTGENTPPTIRIRLEVGFPTTPPAPSRLATTVQSRLTRLAADHNMGRPQVAVEGDTVVLRGVAESESQRLVIEKMISMEPGVRAVRNEMTVGAAQ